MILYLGQGSSVGDAYAICLRGAVSYREFSRRAKVRAGTYAANLLRDLHEAIFKRSLDLKRDYVRYYNGEYETFDLYLRRRFLFGTAVVRKLSAVFAQSDQILLFEPAHAFLEGEYGQRFLERLLVAGDSV